MKNVLILDLKDGKVSGLLLHNQQILRSFYFYSASCLVYDIDIQIIRIIPFLNLKYIFEEIVIIYNFSHNGKSHYVKSAGLKQKKNYIKFPSPCTKCPYFEPLLPATSFVTSRGAVFTQPRSWPLQVTGDRSKARRALVTSRSYSAVPRYSVQ